MGVSLVTTIHNRPDTTRRGLESIFVQGYPDLEVVVVDDTSDKEVVDIVKQFPVKYIRLNREHNGKALNWARPLNIGIRAASNNTIILQEVEVVHKGLDTITKLVDAVNMDDNLWVFGEVWNRNGDKLTGPFFTPDHMRYNAFFLSAIKKKWLTQIRGLDEDFIYPGFDDNDLGMRLIEGCGIRHLCCWDIKGEHLAHDVADIGPENSELFNRKLRDMRSGKISHIRNLDREWGAI